MSEITTKNKYVEIIFLILVMLIGFTSYYLYLQTKIIYTKRAAGNFCQALINNDNNKALSYCSKAISKEDIERFKSVITCDFKFYDPTDNVIRDFHIKEIVLSRKTDHYVNKGWDEFVIHIVFISKKEHCSSTYLIVDKLNSEWRIVRIPTHRF